jgi:3-deoxy-D-manno-octulosonic-acid transferase
MRYILNLLYLTLLFLISPWLVFKAFTTGKYRRDMLTKFLGRAPARAGTRPCIWFHAVSVGEVLLLRQVIARFRRRRPDWEVVLSTTTDTGMDVARKDFSDVCVFYWPFDFTWAVTRALRNIRPNVVVLAELELWPNFIGEAKRQGCSVALINGRLSPRSYRGYGRIRWFVGRLLRQVDLFAVQNPTYAERLVKLGSPGERLHVTGSVKYDGVNTDRNNPKTAELARLLRVTNDDLIWIVGSTQAPEEQIALDLYRKLRQDLPSLRLFLVPRHKERFAEVAQLIAARGFTLVRRSQVTEPVSDRNAVVLLDTLGELGALWGLAGVAFVGGSLTARGGQNMIEPAAYGAAVTFGPNVWNFQETVDRLLEQHAAVQVSDAVALERETRRLLMNAAARAELGRNALEFVASQQGATERTLDLLDTLLPLAEQRAEAA